MWVPIMYALTFMAAIFAVSSFLVRNKKADSQFVLIGIFVCVHCLGKLTVSLSTSREMVIWATRFMNIGSVFCPVMLIFIIQNLCGLKMPAYLKYPFILFAIITFAIMMTIGVTDWYFKKETLKLNDYASDGYTYLIKDYGPAYFLYPLLMLFCFAFLAYYIVYAVRHRKSISYLAILCMCAIPALVVITYAVEVIINSRVSYLSIGYLIGSLVMQWLFTRQQMFDMTVNLAAAVDRVRGFGYIEFDRKYRYVQANSVIKELFPEIEENWQIDKAVPSTDTYLYSEILVWALNPDYYDKVKTVHYKDKYYKISVHDIDYGHSKKVGYLIEFIDKTDEYLYTETIKNYNRDLNEEVARKTAALRYTRDRLVIGMAEMAESRDASTGSHIKRTSSSVEIFSNYLLSVHNPYDLSRSFLKMVAKAAPMHDLGKITIPDGILRKPGRLTDEEYNEMKKHSEAGAEIVENVLRGAGDEQFVDIAKNIAYYHHEKWDGTGYPANLKGEDIPVEARIMALVDVFDALVSVRCYKKAFTYDEAFDIIEKGLGTQFDPELGRAFINCRRELEKLYDKYSDAKGNND